MKIALVMHNQAITVTVLDKTLHKGHLYTVTHH